MLSIALAIAIAGFAIAIAISAWRLARGPAPEDRILALDTLYVNAAALIVILGIALDTTTYFEAALLIALMGFIGTVALAHYLLRGDVID